QSGSTQNPVPARACGFESHLRHSSDAAHGTERSWGDARVNRRFTHMFGLRRCSPGLILPASARRAEELRALPSTTASIAIRGRKRRNSLISMRRSGVAALGLLAAALALTAAGCGGSSNSGAGSSTTGGGSSGNNSALPSSSCTGVEYKGSGDADVL